MYACFDQYSIKLHVCKVKIIQRAINISQMIILLIKSMKCLLCLFAILLSANAIVLTEVVVTKSKMHIKYEDVKIRSLLIVSNSSISVLGFRNTTEWNDFVRGKDYKNSLYMDCFNIEACIYMSPLPIYNATIVIFPIEDTNTELIIRLNCSSEESEELFLFIILLIALIIGLCIQRRY